MLEDNCEDDIAFEVHTTPRTPPFVYNALEAPRNVLGEAICTYSINAVSKELNQKIAELADLVADLPNRLVDGQQIATYQPKYRGSPPNLNMFRPDPDGLPRSVVQDSTTCSSEDDPSVISDEKEETVLPVSPNYFGHRRTESYASNLSGESMTRPTHVSMTKSLTSTETRKSRIPQHLKVQVFSNTRSVVARRVRTEALFEPIFAVLILGNVIFKGLSLQYYSAVGERLSWAHMVDSAFIIAFFFETVVRVVSFRHKFESWDVLDIIVVWLMLGDWLLRMIFDAPWVDPSYLLSAFRTFRVLAALKRSRIWDYLSITRQTRLLVLSVKASFATMLSILVCLTTVVYLIALIMTNGALDLCGSREYQDHDLCFYFGTLWRSSASTYQALLGGISWAVLVDALNGADMHAHASVFVLLFSIVTVGLFQIISSMFVWLVRDICDSEQKLHFMQDHLQEKRHFVERMATLFNDIDLNCNGLISRDELDLAFQDERFTSLFVMMDLDCTAVESLFDLLDLDATGFVDIEQFSLGCLRLRGKARAVDLERTRKDVAAIRSAVELIPIQIADSCQPSDCIGIVRASQPISLRENGTFAQENPLPGNIVMGSNTCNLASGSLVAGRHRNLVEEPAMRALTLRQLQDVACIVSELCLSELWRDPCSGAPLEVAKVNLYDFAFHYINPQTCVDNITLIGVAQREYKKGQILTQVHVNTGRICAKGEIIDSLSDSSGVRLVVNLVKGQFVASDDEELRGSYKMLLDSVCDVGTLREVLHVHSISYKELVSSEPTKAEWFVCHWWGEPVLDFVACCEEHSARRYANTYWVCAYANRQHDLGNDIGDDPESSCFRKAMANAHGLLLLLDRSATPFQRIWCCFELFKTVTNEKMLDIVTMAQEPQLLTQKPIAEELPVNKFLREKHFPLARLTKGVKVSLENGSASKQEDKVHILESMGKDPSSGMFSSERQHENIDFANRTLRGYIAVAAWPQAITKGRVLNFDRKSSECISLPDILKQDVDRVALDMVFSGMQEVTDADVASISQGFPPKLTSLSLSFEGCLKITDRGLSSLADSIAASSLKKLALDFTGCKLLTDEGIGYLGMRLPSELSNASLQFALIPNISKRGAKSFADHLPTNLSQLRITFRGSGFDHQFDSIRHLRKMTR